MSTLVKQQVVLAGVVPVFNVAAAAGDEFLNSGLIMIHAKNAHATVLRTITIAGQADCDLGYSHDVTCIVPISGERISGPFPKRWFNDADGKVQMTYDTEADLTIAVLELP